MRNDEDVWKDQALNILRPSLFVLKRTQPDCNPVKVNNIPLNKRDYGLFDFRRSINLSRFNNSVRDNFILE